MDPNETLRQLYAALSAGEWDEAASLADALSGWTGNGGFEPTREWGDVTLGEIAAAISDQAFAVYQRDNDNWIVVVQEKSLEVEGGIEDALQALGHIVLAHQASS